MTKGAFRDLVEYAPLWLILTLTAWLPLRVRGKVFGAIGAFLAPRIGFARARAMRNFDIAFPDMENDERRRLLRDSSFNMARTAGELLNIPAFRRAPPEIVASGAGLDALRASINAGKGAVLVCAHLGPWVAMYGVVEAQGRAMGAAYAPNSNRYYERRFVRSLLATGGALYARGSEDTRKMLRHVRDGGVIAILSDQRATRGELIPFFGHPAWTSTSAAVIAKRYRVPLIPVFSVRKGAGIEVTFEAPIADAPPTEMMAAFHMRLETWIRAHPDQYFWLHDRWARAPSGESAQKQASVEGQQDEPTYRRHAEQDVE